MKRLMIPFSDQLHRLKAELAVRAGMRVPSVPGTSAFKSGYEDGWRGIPYTNYYTRTDCVADFARGYSRGDHDAKAKITELLAK